MDIEVKMLIDKDVYDVFQIALRRFNHNEKEIIEHYIKVYTSNLWQKDKNNETTIPTTSNSTVEYSGKAISRIPLWAQKPHQYNHKIIKAYLRLATSNNKVALHNLKLICSDKSKPELYVPTFSANYAAMKLDSGNSHGKVFEDDGRFVWIWDGVESTIMQYKHFFE